MVDLVILHAKVITMDPGRRVIQDGALALEGSRISEMGDSAIFAERYPGVETIDASGMAALPGLFNSHMHVGYSLLKGVSSEIVDRLDWLIAVYPYVELATPEDLYWATLLGCLEMIRGGTVFFVENNPFISDPACTDAIATAVEESGLRVGLGRMYSDLNAPAHLLVSEEEMCRETDRLYRAWQGQGDGRIQCWMYAPGPGMRESPARMKAILELVRGYGLRITSHWAEAGGGRGFYTDRYRVDKPTRFLLKEGYLGPETLLVHVVDVDADEIKMLADTGTPVAHCPVANTIRPTNKWEVCPASDMLQAGICVGLGTDASICNDRAGMFETMKQAVLLQKLRAGSPVALTAAQALEMATLNGARLAGQDSELGSLEPGKRADILLLDLRKPHIQPIHHLLENIVYCATEADVDTLIVNGRVLMQGRQVKTIDEGTVLTKVAGLMEKLDAAARVQAPLTAARWKDSYKERLKPGGRGR
jgi:cytosine/adenosine deaminase-related metal-dependent hydrolase